MYKKKERNQNYLFKELFPFGGQLEENNRWLRIRGLIPWEELENRYQKYFSSKGGRPGKDGQLIIGLMLLKHMTNRSDEEIVFELQENIYWQAFCGLEHFQTRRLLDPSTLTKLRKRLGIKFIKELESETYKVLIEKKIIKGKGLMVDGTVFPESVKYPNDVGILNDVREWVIKKIKTIRKKTGEKVRTYCRKARKIYLNFVKKKQKTKKMIKKTKRQMLQYVKRNIKQLRAMIKGKKEEAEVKIEEKIKLAERILEQQYEMYRKNTNRIKGRIVSFYREYVRPIKRGKNGKPVEFGPKAAVSYVGGFLFLDKMSHDNFSEAKTEVIETQIEGYVNKFGKFPISFTGDKLYGTTENREMLKEKGIRSAFKALGRKRKGKEKTSGEQWFKRKQRERNRIEGGFGNAKEHYGLDKILYNGVEGAEIWVRASIMGMNLKTALSKI